MTKKEVLKLLQNHTYCRIQVSKIHGVGVFAIKEIPKNVDPFKGVRATKWHGITQKELEKLDSKLKRLVYDFCSIQEGKIWVPDFGMSNMTLSFYMNTSKKANIRAVGEGEEFLTMRLIKSGEELLVDYDTFSRRDF